MDDYHFKEMQEEEFIFLVKFAVYTAAYPFAVLSVNRMLNTFIHR